MEGERDISRHGRGVVSQGLGLGRAPTLATKSLRGLDVEVSMISCGSDKLGMTPVIPPEDSFVLGVYLTELPEHEIWSRGRLAIRQRFPQNSMLLVNLLDEYAANIFCPHQTLSLHIPRAALNKLTDETGQPRVSDLSCQPGTIDPVLTQLAATFLTAFAHPEHVNALFVDHLALATCAHLAGRYGDFKVDPAQSQHRGDGRLAAWQERRAKDLIDANPGSTLSLAELAAACGLSVGHFARAFKKTTGQPPHSWLLERRIDGAKQLLLGSDLPIADIAVKYGFADQSHFTRVFTQRTGVAPGTWRRTRKD